MSESKNLYQRIVAVMEHMGAVGKGGKTSYGEKYEYHRIDDIDDKLRVALVANGLVATIVAIDDRKLEHFEEKDRNGNPRTTWSCECFITIEIVNAEKPDERLTIKGWGQGLDYSDKATGKAISYAAKAAYLSAFHLRGQPDNEQDNIQKPVAEAPKQSKAVVEWLDAISKCESIEDLDGLGEVLRNAKPEVQDAVRRPYGERRKVLKSREVSDS